MEIDRLDALGPGLELFLDTTRVLAIRGLDYHAHYGRLLLIAWCVNRRGKVQKWQGADELYTFDCQ